MRKLKLVSRPNNKAQIGTRITRRKLDVNGNVSRNKAKLDAWPKSKEIANGKHQGRDLRIQGICVTFTP